MEQGKGEELVQEMSEALAELPLEHKDYEKCVELLSQVQQYVEGTYTIFPQKEKEPEVISNRQMSLFDFMDMSALAEPENTVLPEVQSRRFPKRQRKLYRKKQNRSFRLRKFLRNRFLLRKPKNCGKKVMNTKIMCCPTG